MRWLSEVCPLHSSFQHSGWPHAFAQDILWTGLSETSLHIHHPRPKLKSIHTWDTRAGIGNGTLRMKCVEIVSKSVISPWWKATSALSQLCKMLVPPLRTCCRRGLDCWWCDHVWLMNSSFVNLKLLQKPKAYFFGLFKKALLQCVPTSREKLDRANDCYQPQMCLLDPVLKHNCPNPQRIGFSSQSMSKLDLSSFGRAGAFSQEVFFLQLFAVFGAVGPWQFHFATGRPFTEDGQHVTAESKSSFAESLPFASITFNNPNQPLVTPSHRWW